MLASAAKNMAPMRALLFSLCTPSLLIHFCLLLDKYFLKNKEPICHIKSTLQYLLTGGLQNVFLRIIPYYCAAKSGVPLKKY
ncbi:hypothetical protein CNECB9_560028 [Cupriavidus necator]|uniref:Uncharacterized protein n=1 Tax=Cupriavidus necator TaxID=106590 RepID=A0A1K0JL38_CUPNE|nr:hypothetical protein CNECB9_560028 [Cupriavidus necator]